jgi:hypothetical protein
MLPCGFTHGAGSVSKEQRQDSDNLNLRSLLFTWSSHYCRQSAYCSQIHCFQVQCLYFRILCSAAPLSSGFQVDLVDERFVRRRRGALRPVFPSLWFLEGDTRSALASSLDGPVSALAPAAGFCVLTRSSSSLSSSSGTRTIFSCY